MKNLAKSSVARIRWRLSITCCASATKTANGGNCKIKPLVAGILRFSGFGDFPEAFLLFCRAAMPNYFRHFAFLCRTSRGAFRCPARRFGAQSRHIFGPAHALRFERICLTAHAIPDALPRHSACAQHAKRAFCRRLSFLIGNPCGVECCRNMRVFTGDICFFAFYKLGVREFFICKPCSLPPS